MSNDQCPIPNAQAAAPRILNTEYSLPIWSLGFGHSLVIASLVIGHFFTLRSAERSLPRDPERYIRKAGGALQPVCRSCRAAAASAFATRWWSLPKDCRS